MPERPSCAAVAGKIFHSASESIDHWIYEWNSSDRTELVTIGTEAVEVYAPAEIEESSKDFTPDEWKRYGRATSVKPRGEDMDWFRAVGIPNMVNAYVDWRISIQGELMLAEIDGFGPAIEVPFDHYINGQLVKGYIDRVFTDVATGTQYYPVDLKSGAKPKTDEQLGVYGAALKAALGWDVTYGFYVYGLKTGEAKVTPPLNISHWNEEKLGKVYLPATLQIEQNLYIPHPGEACFFCGVIDHCEFAQAVI